VQKEESARKRFPVTIRRGSIAVKVYRVVRGDGRETFKAAWTVGGVRRMREFPTYVQAHAEASLKADQLAAGKITAAADLSGDDAAELTEARNLCGKTPILTALREWARARELAGENIIPALEAWAAHNQKSRTRHTVAHVLDAFLKASRQLGRTVADDHANTFKRIREKFGDSLIDTVSAVQIDAWLAEAATAGTRNTWRKRIVAVWGYAQKKKWLPQGVPTEAQNSERADEGDMKVEIIGAEAFARMLEYFRANHPEYLPALALAGFSGLRASEVHAQEWTDVNLAEGHLKVTKAKRKTPSRRLVPLSPAAVEWLLLTKDRTEFVCSNLAIDRIREIAKKAKFKVPENCFRHSFISHRVAQTQHIAQTALEAGNSPEIIRKHYLELVTKAEGEKWFAIRPGSPADVLGMDGKKVRHA
jgi:integrase